jgi:starch phosphorylase
VQSTFSLHKALAAGRERISEPVNIIRKITVLPRLPEAIAPLRDIAYNLWWSWEPDAQQLFAEIDGDIWESTNHNPVKFLQRVNQAALDSAAQDRAWMERYADVMQRFNAYMDPAADTWFGRTYGKKRDQIIAYFSAEFGLHEALPIYSGGLGILAGDHCKSASDLGLPFIGVGFLYPQGYFTQRIDEDGMQQAEYEKIDFAEVPATPALDKEGQPVLVNVDLPGRTVYAKVWRIQVGRVPIYLMDTDVPRNAPPDRELSARLYGGDREMRISQEVVLGIGGVRAVRALGYEPAVWHMNEGHSAFLGLERLREFIQGQGLTIDEAIEAVRAGTLFTTHTPVPAGNDSFDFNLVEKFFWQYYTQLGIERDRFMSFARQELPWGPQYSMTVLALKLSAYANGVSKLHGTVSRGMWNFLWPGLPTSEVPIGHITNGIHTKTWVQKELRDLYQRYFAPEWGSEFDIAERWTVDRIPDGELWQAHLERKARVIEFARKRLQRQAIRHGEGPALVASLGNALNPNALTLGFARRFATYKRAMLIFSDTNRLLRLLNDPDRPVQIIFAGKAHPADEPGKALIQRIHQLSRSPEFFGKVIFLEDYDMNMARQLVSGVDVWLNNPRRPLEASGTSGEKAAANGVPNFSALDGWWEEGYAGDNGWAIGESRVYKDEETQDEADVLSLYSVLEDEIIPLFYERDEAGVPHGWVEVMKKAIFTDAPVYSMDRQVKDYVTRYYLHAMETGAAMTADNSRAARDLAAWKGSLQPRWGGVRIEASVDEGPDQIRVGEALRIRARAWLNGFSAEEIAVEAVYTDAAADDGSGALHVQPLEPSGNEEGAALYSGAIQLTDSGRVELGVRARPRHPDLINPAETGLITWA